MWRRRIRNMGLLLAALCGTTVYGFENKTRETLLHNVREIELAPARLALSSPGKTPPAYGVDTAPAVTEKDLEKIDSLIQADGSFRGIDYQDKGRSLWSVLDHLDYCRSLAIAIHVFPESLLKKYDVRRNCLKSFDWWLKKRPHNPNWWNNEVYMMQMVGNIALLLEEKELTPERQDAVRALTLGAKPSRTGQNLMWMSWNSVLAGLVTRDDSRVEAALKSMEGAVTIASPGQEGIQPDMSFHQHGPQLYQGNYGRHYLHSASKWARVVKGTSLANPAKVALVEDYMLDGTRWMCRGALLDYSVWGRQMTYSDRFQGPDIIYACLNMAASGGRRKGEVEKFAASLTEGAGAVDPLSGTRVFPYSDYAVLRTPSFMSSVRMSSRRTLVGEECNGDNLKGAYLSDGCMMTYRDGREYDGIFPVWDWTCIPGTTARRGYMPGIAQWSGKRGGSAFAGGLEEGVAGMECSRFGLAARKSWFFYPDRVVCLGSGITAEENKKVSGHVMTTVEQSLLKKGQVSRTMGKKIQSVVHGESVYLFPRAANLLVENSARKGNWHSIRSGSADMPEEKSVFLLAVDHGENPQGSSYVYQVLPEGKRGTSPDDCWEQVRIVRQDGKVHAVACNGEYRVVFFEPGQFETKEGKIYRTEEPCFLAVSSQGEVRKSLPGKRP